MRAQGATGSRSGRWARMLGWEGNARAQASPPRATCRPTPGGGAGTLSVVDNRTGRRYEIPVDDHGLIKAMDLKQITAGGDGVGLRTYDNG